MVAEVIVGDAVYGIDGIGDAGDFVFGDVGGGEGCGETEGAVIYYWSDSADEAGILEGFNFVEDGFGGGVQGGSDFVEWVGGEG